MFTTTHGVAHDELISHRVPAIEIGITCDAAGRLHVTGATAAAPLQLIIGEKYVFVCSGLPAAGATLSVIRFDHATGRECTTTALLRPSRSGDAPRRVTLIAMEPCRVIDPSSGVDLIVFR